MPQFRSRRHFAGLLGGGLATVAGLPVLGRTRAKPVTEADVSKLYDAAKKEGVVIWWTAQTSVGVAESIRDAFRAKYPGIEVQLSSWIFPLRAGVAAADGRRLNNIKYYRSSADRLLTGIPEVVAKWRETFGV